MRITVFGASGPTGRHVVRQALDDGHRVVAVTRAPDRFPLSHPGLEVAAADVRDPAGVRCAVSGSDAVLSTYGVPYSRRRVSVYSEGAVGLVEAMRAAGVSRLVCVSSTTVGEEPAPEETLLWRRVVSPLLRRVVGRTLYDDMERMELVVRSSGLDWTVLRPGGLFDGEAPTGSVVVGPPRLPGRLTARPDLAAALLAEATGPGHPRQVVEVITRAVPDRSLGDVWREIRGVRD